MIDSLSMSASRWNPDPMTRGNHLTLLARARAVAEQQRQQFGTVIGLSISSDRDDRPRKRERAESLTFPSDRALKFVMKPGSFLAAQFNEAELGVLLQQ